MKKGRIICGVLTILSIVILIISFICMLNDKYFTVIGLYKQPICEIDLHSFQGDICSECDSNICDSGILCPLSEEYVYSINNKDSSLNLRFSNYFDNYDNYYKVETRLCCFAFTVVIDLFLGIILCIVDLALFIIDRKSKKEGKSK